MSAGLMHGPIRQSNHSTNFKIARESSQPEFSEPPTGRSLQPPAALIGATLPAQVSNTDRRTFTMQAFIGSTLLTNKTAQPQNTPFEIPTTGSPVSY
jgi:hypothetical protein